MTRERKKSGMWDKPKKEVLVLRGTKEEIAPLFKKEMETVKKSWERDTGFERQFQIAKTLLSKCLDDSDFRKRIDKHFDPNNDLFLLQPKVLRDLVANLKKENEVDKLENLIESLSHLEKVYSARIILRKDENGEIIIIGPEYGFPNFDFFKIKGPEITSEESPEKIISFYKKITKFKCIYNEIEIQDEADGSGVKKPSTNLLFEILSAASNVSPTIIKYERPKGVKRMLICVPPDMDITTLVKKYGALISKVHSDFYEKRFKGRPKSMLNTGKLIYKIWEQWFKGKKFSINTRCQIASSVLAENYRVGISPVTIRRHYLKEIKGEIGGK